MKTLTHATDAAPLTPAERAYLEQRLIDERRRIRRTLASLFGAEDGAPVVTRYSDHMAEEGAESTRQQLDAAFATRDTATLYEIDAALRRLYQHPSRFGLDEVTGEPIPFARLDVLPWARRRAAASTADSGRASTRTARRRADAA
ncbi:MAG: TraR/DksA family transcriptional regulator [Gemmatirosa sp.]